MKNKITISNLKNLALILLITTNSITAQDVKPDSVELKMFNNAIYGSVGISMELIGESWFTGTTYYERMLPRNALKSNISSFVKVGFGGMAGWEFTSPFVLGQFGLLTGVKKHHFEVSAGMVKSLDKNYDFFSPSGSIGYRIQKPNGHFIFRTGLGWPEALYLGLGASF
jgi:hypothetical protein